MLVAGGKKRGGMKVESSIKATYTEPLEPIVGRNSLNEETSEGAGKSLDHDMREGSNDLAMKEEKKREEGMVYPLDRMYWVVKLLIAFPSTLSAPASTRGNIFGVLQRSHFGVPSL
ncbi:hypothetical protein HZH68_002227 [Vespula germanica]|uniref:Uncharacterized protein n=1 Tax=Vespula germanica TaxID=30212 RepID=A0A834KVP8_VESGE|nr:hypothetical protein HZH68_002227 [Vespula germanica]